VPYNAFADNTSIFICLADVASQICEIPRNSPKIRTYGQCWNWPRRTGDQLPTCLQFLPRDWNLKPTFTQKLVSVRDLRSFGIRFDFESYVRFKIRFVLMVRFEIFESSALSIVIRKETTITTLLIAVQGHPKSSILMLMESAYTTSY